MKLRKLVSVLAIISLLVLSLSAATVMVGAQGPEETPIEQAAQQATPEPITYVVQGGDTYASIAEKFGITVEALLAANGLDGSQTPVVGQELVIPQPVVEETPTEEATATPTEEVTPTEEITITPTVEVTPTEEATVTPTLEPTATVTPTEEATPTPTVEPTATVTPTEVVPTPEPTVSTAGEISAQAIPGSWTSEYIAIQNLGTSPAGVVLDLYPQGSSTAVSPSPSYAIPVQGNVSFSASSLSIGNGAYAGIVSSNEPIAAAVFNVNRTGKVGDMYLGFNTPAISQTLPLIYRNHYNNKSKFYIQNTSASSQTVTVKAYIVGSSTPSATVSYGIAANTSLAVDFMSSAFNGFGSGDGHYGYAVIEGTGGNIAVVHETTKDTGSAASTLQTLYDGYNADAAGLDLVAPLVYDDHYDWKTGLSVVNVGNEDTTVQMTYYSNKGTTNASITVPAHSAGLFYMPYYPPAKSYGAATLHSTNANSKIIAIANNTNLVKGSGSALVALNLNSATHDVAFPMVYNGAGSWQAGINVYAVEDGTLQATWVKANVDPTGAGNTLAPAAIPVAANSVTLYYGPYILPSNFVGAVYIHSTGKILAVGNFPNTSLSVGGQMPGYSYTP